jgi:hypothetical protein
MSKTIYVVTSGEYSDYSINAVFDDEELAKAYRDAFSTKGYGSRLEMEEYEANAVEHNGWAPGLFPWNAEIAEDGEIVKLELKPDYGWHLGIGDRFKYADKSDVIVLLCSFLARDEEHARKIAGERWAKKKATMPRKG